METPDLDCCVEEGQLYILFGTEIQFTLKRKEVNGKLITQWNVHKNQLPVSELYADRWPNY